MNGFFNIDLAATCKRGGGRHVWDEPDACGRSSCVVCAEPCTASNVGDGVPRAMLVEELSRGPVERGITR